MASETPPPKERTVRPALIVVAGLAVIIIAIAALRIFAFPPAPASRISSELDEIMVDCEWFGTGIAWLDSDEDGVRDDSEVGLRGVGIYIGLYDPAPVRDSTTGITDSRGEAGLPNLFYAGCDYDSFDVYPEVPVGMRLTTEKSIRADTNQIGLSYAFGFAYLPGVATGTPVPIPICKTYRDFVDSPNSVLTDLAVAPDGTIWAATFGRGAARYDPASDDWTNVNVNEDGQHNEVWQVTVAPNGDVWFATERDPVRLSEGQWTSFETFDSLPTRPTYGIAIAPDGTAWFTHEVGAVQYNQTTGKFKTFNYRVVFKEARSPIGIFAAPDGSIWLPTGNSETVRLIPPAHDGLEPEWQSLSSLARETSTYADSAIFYPVSDIAIAADGSLWFASDSGFAHYESEAERWTNYTLENTQGGFDVDNIHSVAISQDGSIWVGGGFDIPMVNRLIPATADRPYDIWMTYEMRDGVERLTSGNDPVVSIAPAPDGAIWFGTRDAATRCVFDN